MKGHLRTVAWCAAAVIVTVPSADNWSWLTALSIAIGAGALAACGQRATPLAVPFVFGLLYLAPSLRGEVSGVLGMTLLAVTASVSGAIRYRSVADMPAQRSVTAAASVGLFALYWFGVQATTSLSGALVMAVYFSGSSVIVLLVGLDPALRKSVLRLFAASIGVLGWAALAAVPLMAFDIMSSAAFPAQTLDGRYLFSYQSWASITLTIGDGPIGIPRVSAIAAEPGAWALLCISALGAAEVSLSGRPRRVAQVGAVAGLILSQSTGALLLSGAAAAFCVIWAAAGGSVRGRAVARVALSGLLLAPLALWLLDGKLTSSARSAEYRGLGFLLGDKADVGSRNEFAGINLLTLFPEQGLAILLPVLGAIVLISMSRGVVVRICTFATMTMMIAIQPSQYHLAIWIVLALVAIQSRQSRVASGPVQATYDSTLPRAAIGEQPEARSLREYPV